MKLFISLIVFSLMTLSLGAMAAKGMGPRSSKVLKVSFADHAMIATLEEGYHFNEKAPNGIQYKDHFTKPTSFTPRTLKVENLPSESVSGTIHLYVCDDKMTFCEMNSLAWGKSEDVPSASKEKGPKEKGMHNGFIVNDFELALKRAEKQKKMMIVDFGARWCPACVRLETEIFSNKEFQKETKSYVKAKIDIDVFSSAVLGERYNIKGVPSVLVLTSDGREVARFVDYQPLSFIKEVLVEAKKYPFAIEDLEKKPLTPEMKLSLAKRYFYSNQFSKSLAVMNELKSQPVVAGQPAVSLPKEFWFAKIGEAEEAAKKDPKAKSAYVDTLKEAIKADPESSRSIMWRSSLIDALEDKKDEQKKIAKEANALTDKILANEDALKKATETDMVGEYTGLEGLYVAMINAEASAAADYEPKAAWQKVITQAEKYHINGKSPGTSLRLLSAMMQAEEFEKALSLVNEMLAQKPQDGDLQRRKMRVLMELKKYDEAIQLGEAALKNSYGANEFFVVEPLAKAYIAANKKEKAKDLISQYLSRNEINFSDLQSIKGKLEKLKEQL